MFRRNLVVIGQPFEPKFEGRKCTAEELRAVADELMARIYALGEEQQ